MNTTDELNDDFNYINGLFYSFGMEEFPFKAIFDISDEHKGANKYMMLDNKARVCSLLIQLLHSKQKEEIYRKDSEERMTRLMEEIRNMELQQKRQDDKIKLQDRELVNHRQSQQLFSEKQRQLESSATGLRDEITKLKQVYVQKERQFQHELRKKEKEYEKLKDQLASVLKDMQLREQKSEIHYNPNQSVREALSSTNSSEDAEIDNVEVESEGAETVPADRVTEIESENDRLRQIISYTYGNLVQLVVDLFPEIELDQSILGLLETSPMAWIEEQLAQKVEEVFEILRDNLINLALNQQKMFLKEHQDQLDRLNAQIQASNSTITSQNATIKSLELQLKQIEEYKTKAEDFESENRKLHDLMNQRAKFDEKIENQAPGTPKWMKNHAS